MVALCLRYEEAEFSVTAGQTAGERIFHDTGQHGVGHDESTLTTALKAVGEQAECVGVALEVGEIIPKLRTQLLVQIVAFALGEERLYGLFAGVPKWWISQVVGQTSCRHDGANLFEERSREFGVECLEFSDHVCTERHAHTGHLQAMGEPVVYEDGAREREHLGLVLESAERRGEDETVVVALEFRAVVVSQRVAVLLSETHVGYQLLPFHRAKVIKIG